VWILRKGVAKEDVMGSLWKLRLILPNILAALATLVSVGAVTQPASAARLDLGIAATAFPGRFGTQLDSRSATSTSSGVDYSIKVDTLVYQCSSSCTSAAAGVFTYVYRLAVTSATPAPTPCQARGRRFLSRPPCSLWVWASY